MLRRRKKPAYKILYVLQNGDTNQFKIGRTKDLNQRLAQLQTGCPGELKIVTLWKHPQEKIIKHYERVLHNYFTKCGCRIRPNGEWFELRTPDLAQLCKPKTVAEQNQMIEDFLKMM